jgi:hypothetical protein
MTVLDDHLPVDLDGVDALGPGRVHHRPYRVAAGLSFGQVFAPHDEIRPLANLQRADPVGQSDGSGAADRGYGENIFGAISSTHRSQ